MSNGDNSMSFEDAMKKIVNTKLSPSIRIDKLDEKHQIVGVANKYIFFSQIAVFDKDVDRFYLRVYLKIQENPEESESNKQKFKEKEIDVLWEKDRYQNRGDTVLIKPEEGVNPVFIPKFSFVSVSLKAINPDENFEIGILYYKVLDRL